MSFERDDQQGGCKDEHDRRNEDPQVIEKNQVDHIGLSEVFFLRGVGRGIEELLQYMVLMSLEKSTL